MTFRRFKREAAGWAQVATAMAAGAALLLYFEFLALFQFHFLIPVEQGDARRCAEVAAAYWDETYTAIAIGGNEPDVALEDLSECERKGE